MVWKVEIERVTVIKFRMDSGGGNGSGCFEVEIWADTAKFTNMIVAGFRMRLRAEWVVMREESCILESCCLSPTRKKLSFRRVDSQKVCSHPGRDLTKSRGPRTEPWGTPHRQVCREERHLTRKQRDDR